MVIATDSPHRAFGTNHHLAHPSRGLSSLIVFTMSSPRRPFVNRTGILPSRSRILRSLSGLPLISDISAIALPTIRPFRRFFATSSPRANSCTVSQARCGSRHPSLFRSYKFANSHKSASISASCNHIWLNDYLILLRPNVPYWGCIFLPNHSPPYHPPSCN